MLKFKSSLLALSVPLLIACGGSQPAAEDATAAPAEAKDVNEDAKSEGEKEEAKKDGDSSDSAAPEAGPGPVQRTAKDIVTAPETTFMFSFNQSEPKEKAEERCDAQAKGDAKTKALCMKKESSKFGEDGLQFKQEGGKWYFITVRRKGKTLTTLHKIPFEFGEDKADRVVLKTTGRDTGKAPKGNVPKEIVIEVPNEFSIALKDPDAGRLVYEAKIGITSADKGP
jgi:hypothetical protein